MTVPMGAANSGRQSTDPIWDNGEALLYRAVVTLLLDWFPRHDLTMRSLVRLVNLCDIPEEGAAAERSPLDLLFDQIETGYKTVSSAGDAAAIGPRGPFDARRPAARTGRIPSPLRRRDGVAPYERVRDDGTRGLDADEDEALSLWHQFRHGAGKTLKSFVISSHARLAYISTPEVLRALAGEDGRDAIRLDLLGQEEDELGRPLAPRVVFVISSDFKDSLNSLPSMIMWQAIYLPMGAADQRGGGRLPRPVSIVVDEFANVGKIGSFAKSISVVRSRDIDITIMVQSLSQIEDNYGREAASTIRENCAATLFLGGARATSSAKAISEEAGKETAYKYDWSRRGQGLGAEHTRSRGSLARDVYDPMEVATLPAGRALVLMGDRQVIEDDKSLVWEHPRYDPTYMGDPPERSFDYAAWRDAGRPTGEALARWDEVHLAEVAPAKAAAYEAARHGDPAGPEEAAARHEVAALRSELTATREAAAAQGARLDAALRHARPAAAGRDDEGQPIAG